jgi:penicillin-binding protein 2
MSFDFVSNPEAAKEYIPRYRFVYVLMFFTMVVFSSRLWYLQIIQGNELREFSEKNRIKETKVMAPRGLILDRDKKILVENLAAYDAVITPQYIENLEESAIAMGEALNIDPDKILLKVSRNRKKSGPYAQVSIKENLNLDEVYRLRRIRIDFPGLDIRENVIRSYPLHESGAQLFGYVAEISKTQIPTLNKKYQELYNFEQGDIIGKAGIEELLDLDLRGKDGYSFLQVDAHGREIAANVNANNASSILGMQIKNIETTPGYNIELTLDKDIQDAAYKSFEANQRIGAGIAMKSNGEILAWVSTPSFDPNEFAKGINPEVWSKLGSNPFKPMRNKVIQDHASPGSTFKPMMAVTALQEKVITPTTIVNAPGSLKFGNRVYHDSKKGGYGNITVLEALERSSNIFFYKMGMALGIDKMYDYIHLFGLGTRSGIELPRENPGLMPSAEWKKKTLGEEWQLGENLSVAIGQGFVVATPIQMAIAYNTIGLEGKVVKPFFIKRVLDTSGKVLREYNPQVLRNLQEAQPNGVRVDESTFKIVKEGMRRVANSDRGTAHWWKIPGIEMAGKTGTSQVMSFSADQIYQNCMSRPIHMRHHGWYIAYAPADKPEITVAVLAEHACHGNTGAAPIVRDIILAYMQKNHPDWIEAGLKNAKMRLVHPAAALVKPTSDLESDEE